MTQHARPAHAGFRLVVVALAAALAVWPASMAFAEEIDGTNRDDTIVGTPNDDTINGGDGNDTIIGDGGSQTGAPPAGPVNRVSNTTEAPDKVAPDAQMGFGAKVGIGVLLLGALVAVLAVLRRRLANE